MPESWDTDRIYTFESKGNWHVFVSPDGVGKVFYVTEREAMQETGNRSVVHLMSPPSDWMM